MANQFEPPVRVGCVLFSIWQAGRNRFTELAGRFADSTYCEAQVTVASAAGGAVVMGAGGGAVGTGFGVVLAPFTLGLSIPLGFCVGTAAGGAAGLVTGGAAGYNKDSISNGMSSGYSKVQEYFQPHKVG